MKIITLTVGSFHTNCYLVIDEAENEAAIIDPGGSAELIISAIKESGARVTAIILTHGHFDHVVAINEVRRFTGADVYIHSLDAVMLKDRHLSFLPKSFETDEPEHLLNDGDVIDIGSSSFTVIHTPGHTRGSICLMFNYGMISGDTLFYRNIGRCDLPGGDEDTIMQSLEKLASMSIVGTVYPGHGPVTSMNDEIKFNPYLRKDNI